MRADANKMVHRTKRAHGGPFFHNHVSAQSCGVRQNDVVADYAVMGNVRVGHDQGMAADAGHASAFGGAAIQSYKLAHGVVVAYFQNEWARPGKSNLRR